MPIPDCTRFQQTDTFAETPRAITYYQTRFFGPGGGSASLPIMRGFDSGTNAYTTWRSFTLTPDPSICTPTLVGSLSDVHLESPGG